MNLLDVARTAGRAGRIWNDFTSSDDAQEAAGDGDLDMDALEQAFVEGRREHRIASGWRLVWTTAPADYDSFGTEAVEEGGKYHGKQLRRVLIDPGHYAYQTARYGSGLHPSWDEDPRVTDAKVQARIEQERAEWRAREEKRAAGREWLKTAAVDEMDDYDTYVAHGVNSDDVREERRRRLTETYEKARQEEWARCLQIIPEGATLIDRGEPSRRWEFGVIPGRDACIYYNVRIVRGWPDEADRAHVDGEGGRNAGSAALVADWIKSGRLRVATPEDGVPPRPVWERIKPDCVTDIRRVVAGGRTVWVGRPKFSYEYLVLDEKGHLVRAKKVVEEALR